MKKSPRRFNCDKKYIYLPCGFVCSNLKPEEQNAEYGAYIFKLNDLSIRFRTAKITPTKIGQFVTLWERVGKKPIQPYDVSDPIDYFVICVRQNDHFGHFVFPKTFYLKKISYQKMEKVEKGRYASIHLGTDR